ncbi:spore germination protein GerPE [Paenibacillus piri]|uniref:Spore germination protein GerPE n=1 Tax=Paenibacillus piri TaxID=2547395 RepID=A0A4R5KQT9_9BACL|nr:spore germination protein GerPE [Paenibacillus piri]TDF98139.1 spore germination protein GerPE [Paenibacillus piri]
MNRWSSVWDMKVNTVSQSAVLQIGDNVMIQPVTKVLAVQRELPEFEGKEGNLADFDIYSREIPLPPIDNDPVQTSFDQSGSRIHVGCVYVLGVTAASVLQVGGNQRIKAESRILHIRHFFTEPASKTSPAATSSSQQSPLNRQ